MDFMTRDAIIALVDRIWAAAIEKMQMDALMDRIWNVVSEEIKSERDELARWADEGGA